MNTGKADQPADKTTADGAEPVAVDPDRRVGARVLDKLGFLLWVATVLLLAAALLMWLVAGDTSLLPWLALTAIGVVLTEVGGVGSDRFHR